MKKIISKSNYYTVNEAEVVVVLTFEDGTKKTAAWVCDIYDGVLLYMDRELFMMMDIEGEPFDTKIMQSYVIIPKLDKLLSKYEVLSDITSTYIPYKR